MMDNKKKMLDEKELESVIGGYILLDGDNIKLYNDSTGEFLGTFQNDETGWAALQKVARVFNTSLQLK